MNRTFKTLGRQLTAAGVAAFTAAGPHAHAGEDGERPRPNIVFFMSDDHRNDVLSAAGHPVVETPVIDGLAEEGVRFENAFVTTSICAASRASILTGVHERTHGYTFGTPPVPEPYAAASYPRLLREAGYRTGFFGKYGVQMDMAPGDLFDDYSIRDRPYLGDDRPHIDEINTAEAIAFLEDQTSDQPFCLSVSFSSPHAEDGDLENHFPAIEATRGMYDDVEVPRPRLDDQADPAVFENQPEFLRDSMNRDRYYWRWDTPEKYQKNMRDYLAMVSGVDHMIGEMLEVLEARGLADNTIVIFTGDNGFYMGERGFAGKWSHYEESLRVPLVIHDPRTRGAVRGATPEAMVLNIDIPATILDYGGVPIPAHYGGRSLRPFAEGETPDAWREDFFGEHLFDHPRIPQWEGVRGQRHIYARYFTQEPVYEFLHDLEADPDQLQNFADDPEYSEILDELRERTDELRTRYTDVLETEAAASAP